MRRSIIYYVLVPLVISLFSSVSIAFAAEYLDPIGADRIQIDGRSDDWKHIRRQSAEYLLDGVLAELDDFQGGLKIAYNRQWLYFAIDCTDSDLVLNKRRGDSVSLSLSGAKRSRAVFTFSFPKPLKKQKRRQRPERSIRVRGGKGGSASPTFVYMTLNGKRSNAGEVRAVISESKAYFIEAKIPMSVVPWVYGGEVKLAAIFNDVDLDRYNSTYATHLIEGDGSASEVSYIFGGARIFREIYHQQVGDLRVLAELRHQLIGDQRDEEILITDAEIAVFGEGVSPNGGIVRYIHGWRDPTIVSATVVGHGSSSRIVVKYKTKGREDVQTERFVLKNGTLRSK